MASKLSLVERVLNCAQKNTSVDSSILRRYFKATDMDSEQFNGTIMRTARYAAEQGLLKRTDVGVYQITKKGTQYLAQA